MGLRQRSGFDGLSGDAKREDLNLTKYEEKYILPTDGGASVTGTERGGVSPSGLQSPVQTPAPAPDPSARSFVFGERQRSFGDVQADASAPSAPYTAPAAPTATGERPMVFVLRDDRDMYVYEYSDRLEYFRRTELGMVYCATKFKVKRI